jgi:hypothetical protein
MKWGGRWDSNPRRPESQSGALPTELRPPSSKPAASSHSSTLQFINLFQPATLTASASAVSRPASRAQVARPAGLEPATLGLEGRCSIQLSYGRSPHLTIALPVRQFSDTSIARLCRRGELVGARGFEPPTLCSQSRCATRLRYAPPENRCIRTGSRFIISERAPPGTTFD